MVLTRWCRNPAAVLLLALAVGCASKGNPSPYTAPLTPGRPDLASAAKVESKSDRDAKAKQAHREERLRRLQAALITRGDPDSLAAAALIGRVLPGVTSPSSLDLATAAFMGAPQRADLAFVLLQLCESELTCDPQPLEVRVRQLDPDNGITWSYAMLRAARDNSIEDRNAARDGLARAKRIDIYWNRIVSHLTAAASKAGFDTSAAMLEVIGIEAAMTAALQPVSRACSEQEIQQPAVLLQCRQIAAAYRQGDTILLEMYGSSLAVRLWPQGSPERLAIATERRALHYQMDLMTRNSAKVNSPQATQTLASLYARYPSEQTAYRALDLSLGLIPDPPAVWVDNWNGG